MKYILEKKLIIHIFEKINRSSRWDYKLNSKNMLLTIIFKDESSEEYQLPKEFEKYFKKFKNA